MDKVLLQKGTVHAIPAQHLFPDGFRHGFFPHEGIAGLQADQEKGHRKHHSQHQEGLDGTAEDEAEHGEGEGEGELLSY